MHVIRPYVKYSYETYLKNKTTTTIKNTSDNKQCKSQFYLEIRKKSKEAVDCLSLARKKHTTMIAKQILKHCFQNFRNKYKELQGYKELDAGNIQRIQVMIKIEELLSSKQESKTSTNKQGINAISKLNLVNH